MSEYIDLNLHEDLILSKDYNILSSEAELFLQEIEIAMKMDSDDVWGIRGGFNLQDYVFAQYITEYEISNKLRNYIQDNCWHSQYFNWNVSVKIEDSGKMLVISFIVEQLKPSKRFMKTFKITA